ncbi:hypothetical protein KIN20_023282 [Parelaphostrongylus tenuis]|uniref:Uncharacterized protein n=1 Tax=Parelaphostrongylus tenuis TaxID=148309 RepID=A0AAD5QXA5_PARTN|nr:hypothetical protein KIN20_023282 [Parelaphostrongylus tenuis]
MVAVVNVHVRGAGKLGSEWRRCAMGGLVRSMDWSFAIHGPTTTRVERLQLVRAAAGLRFVFVFVTFSL